MLIEILVITAGLVFVGVFGYLIWSVYKKVKNSPASKIADTQEDQELKALRDALIEGEKSGFGDGPINIDELISEINENR